VRPEATSGLEFVPDWPAARDVPGAVHALASGGPAPFASTGAASTATEAFVVALGDVLAAGQVAREPTNTRLELRNRTQIIFEPRKRTYILPHRRNSVFASIAETFWVLGGRSDVAFLEPYLPRAADFSDDGRVWRAGYGPRLRDWSGVDQIREVVELFRRKRHSRKAILTLFDPTLDFVESKDIPCHNWLQPLIVNDALALQVVTRCNDVIWGVSGANTFEWSVLAEVIANTFGVDVGPITTFTTTLHVYEWHFERARAIYDAYPGATCYDFGIPEARLEVGFDDLDRVLADFFERERRLVLGELQRPLEPVGDPLVDEALVLLRVYLLHREGAPTEALIQPLDEISENDLKLSALEYLSRGHERLLDEVELSEQARSFFELALPGCERGSATPLDTRKIAFVLRRSVERRRTSFAERDGALVALPGPADAGDLPALLTRLLRELVVALDESGECNLAADELLAQLEARVSSTPVDGVRAAT
jgi:thymidylate synthase